MYSQRSSYINGRILDVLHKFYLDNVLKRSFSASVRVGLSAGALKAPACPH